MGVWEPNREDEDDEGYWRHCRPSVRQQAGHWLGTHWVQGQSSVVLESVEVLGRLFFFFFLSPRPIRSFLPDGTYPPTSCFAWPARWNHFCLLLDVLA